MSETWTIAEDCLSCVTPEKKYMSKTMARTLGVRRTTSSRVSSQPTLSIVPASTESAQHCSPTVTVEPSGLSRFLPVLQLAELLPSSLSRGVRTGEGGISVYIYTTPKSGQVNFLWSNNDARTIIELIPQWVLEFYTSPKTVILPKNKFLATPLSLCAG